MKSLEQVLQDLQERVGGDENKWSRIETNPPKGINALSCRTEKHGSYCVLHHTDGTHSSIYHPMFGRPKVLGLFKMEHKAKEAVASHNNKVVTLA